MAENQIVTYRRERRPLEELNLMDDFLFQQMLEQEADGEEFCRILLGTILGKSIRKVRIIPQKNLLGVDTSRHGIRMDAYIEDISDEEVIPGTEIVDAQVMRDIYDIEPNNTYEKKILPYDPFGQNRMVYTIQNQCVENPLLPYEDGAKKIFLYTKGTEGNPSQALRDMLKYLEKTNDENVTNQDIDTIHHLVKKVKRRKEVGISYMKSWEIDRMNREEGRQEGRQEGIMAVITLLKELGVSREDTLEKLREKFRLSQVQAEEYMDNYWNE